MGDPTPYKPSCGTEGADFMAKFCDHCTKDAGARAGGEGCPLVVWSMICDIGEPNYPKEWVEDADGPRCTAFDPEVAAP